MRSERIEFPGHAGDALAARLDRPVRAPLAVALLAHCFTCSRDIAALRRISSRLVAAGFAVLRFDFTGLGHSEGEFANTTFTSNADDLVAAADWLRDHGPGAPQLLVGHSLGGAAVICAAARIPECRAVATIAAPHEPDRVLRHMEASLDEIRREGSADVRLGERSFKVGRGFVEDISAVRLDETLAGLRRALLVLHSPRDMIVGIENATGIFLAAKHPKSFVTLDDADHLLTDAADADYAAGVIAAWAGRYLDLAADTADTPAAEGNVLVSEADPDGFLQDVTADGHHAVADEPVSHGGTDLGFTPYQLVGAGLAACTSMTLRMYARRKEWPLTHVAVEVGHDKIHADDCAECETRDGKVDRFRRRIRIRGELSDDQRARLMEIADRCPVHRTLEAEIRIETEAAD